LQGLKGVDGAVHAIVSCRGGNLEVMRTCDGSGELLAN